jgi:AcrR family transcriptional regulator
MDPKSIRDQTIKEAKSNLILDAARTVFAEKGFHETRLEDIAAASGFSKASLYNYYTDKEELFMSLAARDYHNLLNTLTSGIDENAPFFTNLERIIRTSIEFFGSHFAFIVSTTNFQLLSQLNPQRLIEHHQVIAKRFRDRYFELMELQAKLIKKAQEQGEVTLAITAQSIATYIGSLVRGTLIEWKMRGVSGDVQHEVGSLLTFIRQGIAARSDENAINAHRSIVN